MKLQAYLSPISQPTTVTGVATFQKKVILYGSEGNVKIFSSDCPNTCDTSGLPTASVQVVKPICLSAKICECPQPRCETIIPIPESICNCFDGCFCCCPCQKQVYITIGLFTIVQLERVVQLMIPAYDFCIPDRCGDGRNPSPEDPCELFRQIKFPTDAFFPPRLNDSSFEDCNNNF